MADTLLQGTHGRRRVGLGESFWQFRKYEPGDSVTRIDWRQSAKGDRLFVRETEWEAAHSLWLWRDTSASMDYASSTSLPTKRGRADLLLLTLANLALRGGERVGLLGQAAVTTQAGLERFASGMSRADNGPADLPPPVNLKKHSTVVLFGDFLGPLPEIAEAIGALSAQGVAGIIVQVLDPAELSLPFKGRVRFDGVEGEASEIVPRAERIADQYRERLAASNWDWSASQPKPAGALCLTALTFPLCRDFCHSIKYWQARFNAIARPAWIYRPLCSAGADRAAVLWWLLRVTPPPPKAIAFPAIRLLRDLVPPEETASRTALMADPLPHSAGHAPRARLAGPVLHPQAPSGIASDLLVVVDNGWAAGANWSARQSMLAAAIDRADHAGRTLIVLPTAPASDGSLPLPIGPGRGATLRGRVDALQPMPWPVKRGDAAKALQALSLPADTEALWLSDGIATPRCGQACRCLETIFRSKIVAARRDWCRRFTAACPVSPTPS